MPPRKRPRREAAAAMSQTDAATYGALKRQYDSQPKTSMRYVGLTVNTEVPEKIEYREPVEPLGNPSFEPGTVVSFPIVVPANQFWRFHEEPLAAEIKLEIDTHAADGSVTGSERLVPNTHHFQPECLNGGALPLVGKLDVMLHNQVVNVYEKDGGALNRYMALSHLSTEEKYGPRLKHNLANYYHPITNNDLKQNNKSDRQKKFTDHIGGAGNASYHVTSPLCGFLGRYDFKRAQKYKRKDLRQSKFLPPNTHLTVNMTMAPKRAGLRSLGMDGATTQAGRQNLWKKNPRITVEKVKLLMDKVVFPEGSDFVASVEAKRKSSKPLVFAFTSDNEVRDAIPESRADAAFRVSLQQLNYPAAVWIYWMPSGELDGSSSMNRNTTVFRYPPNLESLSVKMGQTSLLPVTEKVEGFSTPNQETWSKDALFMNQAKNHRRESDRLHEAFSNDGIQQFIYIDLDPVYYKKKPKDWINLPPIDIRMGFNATLSPAGWQTVVAVVCENQLNFKGDNSHSIVNAAGISSHG